MNKRTVQYLQYAVNEKKVRFRKPRRKRWNGPPRDYRYRAWIRSLPSPVSGQSGCEAAHTGTDGWNAPEGQRLQLHSPYSRGAQGVPCHREERIL